MPLEVENYLTLIESNFSKLNVYATGRAAMPRMDDP